MKPLRIAAIALTGLAMASCASAPPQQAPTVNVTGHWVGTWKCNNPTEPYGIVVLDLTQNGAQVNGHANVTNPGINRNGNFSASLSGATMLVQMFDDLRGEFAVSGDRMSGPFVALGCTGTGGKIALTREPFAGTQTTARLTTVSATVEAIDHASRMVTLKGTESGKLLQIQVDERVRNLAQVGVGDLVTVAYYESWALNLAQPGAPTSAVAVQTASPSAMPSMVVGRTSTIEATVTAIDAGKPSVTFRGPKGNVQEVNVAKDPRILAQLKVGEVYKVTYTESLAVAVERMPKR
jgi:hypothetical protein